MTLHQNLLLRYMKQIQAYHGRPHGRYMQPSFQVFDCKSTDIHSDSTRPYSPIDTPQLCLYVSFLKNSKVGGNKYSFVTVPLSTLGYLWLYESQKQTCQEEVHRWIGLPK